MVKLFIIRHAESEWNPIGRYQGLLDPGLSERGLKQVELLGRALEKEKIDVIYSSPLKRTYQTAQEIAKRQGLEIIEDKRIIEIDHGVWSGMLVEEVRERDKQRKEQVLPQRAQQHPKGSQGNPLNGFTLPRAGR